MRRSRIFRNDHRTQLMQNYDKRRHVHRVWATWSQSTSHIFRHDGFSATQGRTLLAHWSIAHPMHSKNFNALIILFGRFGMFSWSSWSASAQILKNRTLIDNSAVACYNALGLLRSLPSLFRGLVRRLLGNLPRGLLYSCSGDPPGGALGRRFEGCSGCFWKSWFCLKPPIDSSSIPGSTLYYPP